MKRESLNIGVVRLADGTIDAGLYDYPHKAFCHDLCEEHEYVLTGDEVLWALPLCVCGRTYRERQEHLRELAIDAMNAISDAGCYSYGELASIESFFEENGRRYGMLTEFRENAVC